MTPEEIDALGVATDLQTAALALGISKSAAYQARRNGTLPFRVVQVGSRYSVPVYGEDGLRAALGLAS